MKVDIYKNTGGIDLIQINFIYDGIYNDTLYQIIAKINNNTIKYNYDIINNYIISFGCEVSIIGNKTLVNFNVSNYNEKVNLYNENTTLESVKLLFEFISNIKDYLKIEEYNEFQNLLKSSNIYLQIVSDEDTANKILKGIDSKYLNRKNKKFKKNYFKKIDINEIDHKLPCYILQSKDLYIDSNKIIKNEFLCELIEVLAFIYIREDKSLIYGMFPQYNKCKNFLIFTIKYENENREKVKKAVDEFFNKIKTGNFDDKFFEYSKFKFMFEKNNENNIEIVKAIQDLYGEISGYKYDLNLIKYITKEDIIKYFNNFNILEGLCNE